MHSSLKNKIVFVTGASSGIGAACAEQFAAQGARLILTARRLERIEALAKSLDEQYDTDILIFRLDVRDKKNIHDICDHLPTGWQDIDILLNNAGLALSTDKLQDGDPHQWDTMIDTNVKGLLYMTRAIVPKMVARKRGHIINIGSIAGHDYYPGGNVYCATKHAVKAITHGLLVDLSGTAIRVSSIDPGAVETEFSEVRFNDKDRAKQVYQGFTPLTAVDIADAVGYCASRPAHVNIAQMLVLPSAQASVHCIHKED